MNKSLIMAYASLGYIVAIIALFCIVDACNAKPATVTTTPTNPVYESKLKVVDGTVYDMASGLEINVIRVNKCEYVVVRGHEGVAIAHRHDCLYCEKFREIKK